MEVLRNWIAPVLTRALDEHLELSKRKKLNRIHVEEDLSHLDVHCDSVQFVQLVEVRTLSDTWAPSFNAYRKTKMPLVSYSSGREFAQLLCHADGE